MWVKRIFTVFMVSERFLQNFSGHQMQEAKLVDMLTLFCDIDDQYKFNQSLSGHQGIGFLDIILVYYLSEFCHLEKANDIYDITYPIECNNLFRVLDHILQKFSVNFKIFKGK
jgi:hypothetical protein